jgi:peptidoglycan/LPS O-acetylase OafA/YrhL
MSPSSTTPTTRYQTLDAWRAIACLAVVVFHSLAPFEGQPLWAPLEIVRGPSMRGWLGLHLFFVISGYCIFERLGVAQRRGESGWSFAVDRARRIFPTFWAAVVITTMIGLLAMPFNHTPLATNLSPSIARWAANLSLTYVFSGHEPFIVVTWTLACEFMFYLIAATVLAATPRRDGLRAAFVVGTLLCAPAAWIQFDSTRLFILSLWPEFFAGACVSFALRAPRAGSPNLRAPALVVLAALTLCTVLQAGSFAPEPRRWAVGFAWVLFLLFPADAWLAARPVVRFLGGVGAFSYSLYLIHVPLLSRSMNLLSRAIAPTRPAFAALWCVAVLVAVGGGWVCWKLIELPFERHRLARRSGAIRPPPAVVPAPSIPSAK